MVTKDTSRCCMLFFVYVVGLFVMSDSSYIYRKKVRPNIIVSIKRVFLIQHVCLFL